MQAKVMKYFYYFSVFGVVIFANLVAILVLPTLSYFMVPPAYQESWNKIISDATFDFGANSMPFLLVLSVIFFYLWPVFKQAYKNKGPAKISPKAKTRLLNAPFVLSLIALMGWFISSIFIEMYLIYFNIQGAISFKIQIQLMSLVLGSITFVISYYILDFLNRHFFIPHVLPKAKMQDFKDALYISIRQKFYIFLFTIFVLPVSMLLSLIYNLNDGGNNVYHNDLIFPVSFLFSVSFLISLLITIMKAHSIQTPLLKMEQLSKKIENGSYDICLPLESNDEMGILTDSMNQMAAGLLERERLKDVFGKMVDPKVRDHLMSGDLKLGGELREVTILFSDIKNFTAFSEKRRPDEIVSVLNQYFDRMAACITNEGGVINKYIGDAIMAVFGAPVALTNHADAALKAGFAMLKAQAEFKQEFSTAESKLMSRIGIHTGEVLAGNIGASDRMEYTVIGDAVNTASRLETLCKKTKYNLLTSSNTVRLIKDKSLVRYIGRIKVKGKSEYTDVFCSANPEAS